MEHVYNNTLKGSPDFKAMEQKINQGHNMCIDQKGPKMSWQCDQLNTFYHHLLSNDIGTQEYQKASGEINRVFRACTQHHLNEHGGIAKEEEEEEEEEDSEAEEEEEEDPEWNEDNEGWW